MRVVFPPRGGAAPALVVLRGGAYATSHGSGAGAAEWAAENGMVGVEVAYRSRETGDAHPKSYADAARAVRLVRDRAVEWGVDPARVGVLGFSAGGHLMGETAVGSARDLYAGVDTADAQPIRPALAGLIYPVITMRKPFDRTATRRILVGDEVTPDEMKTYSVDLQVGPETPPTFLVQAIDDPVAVADHPLLMFSALRKARVPAELHLFERGGHGFGLGAPGTPVAAWPGLFLAWIRLHGFLRA